MSSMNTTAHVVLLVIYTERMEECREFYDALGIRFEREQHGHGPQHHTAVLPDGTVFELYPATAGRPIDRRSISRCTATRRSSTGQFTVRATSDHP